jgi:hypothetical protein
LTKSISLQPSIVAEQLLGELMFAQGNQDRAVELFKSGLVLASSEVITPVELNDSVDIPKVEPPIGAVPEVEPVVVPGKDASVSVAPVDTNEAVVAATTMDVALGLSKEEIPTVTDTVESIAETPAETIEQPQPQSSVTQEPAEIELPQPTESIESSPIVESVPVVVTPEIDSTSNSQADTMTEAMATVTEEPTSTEAVIQTPVEETKPEPEKKKKFMGFFKKKKKK